MVVLLPSAFAHAPLPHLLLGELLCASISGGYKKYRLKPSRRISAYVVSRLVALNREDNGAMWRSCSKAR